MYQERAGSTPHSWMVPPWSGEQNTNPRVTPLPYLFTEVSHDFWQLPPSRMQDGQGSARGLRFQAKPWWVQP